MRKFFLSTLALAAALSVSHTFAQEAPTVAPTPDAAAADEGVGWWLGLGDPLLSRLIQGGLDANLDIQHAHARILRSRALLAGAQAAYGPSGGLAVGARATQASEAEAPGNTSDQRRTHSVSAGLEFSWELDLFGRLGSQATAASERVRASHAQLEGVKLAVSAEIAHAYFALVGAREQLELARAVAQNRERTVRIVGARSGVGMAPPVDDVRARADLEAALAQIPVQETAVRIASHRIAVLTGQSPESFELPTAGTLQPVSVMLRLPAEQWLAKRPDIREHEAELRARALDIEVVRAEFYPRLSFSGVLGFIAGSVTGLGAASSVSWLAGPSLLAPIFDRPRIEARLGQANAHQKEALAGYHQRILLATEEVQNAIARYTFGQQQFAALQRRAQLAAEAERLSRVRYEAGSADLLELLDAQRTAQQAQAALSGALTEQRQHLVAVFKGSGGGA